MRSCWSRSIMITSTSRTASSRRRATLTPSSSTPGGIRVGGPATVTLMPILRIPAMLERATRLWAMSPTIATESPSRWPRFSRIVIRSRSAWVGCSCIPSPAFTTEHRSVRASMCAAPDAAWRITTQSGLIASMLRAVSMSVSPLATLEDDPETLMTSAESHLPAISNEVRVRVEGSRNRLTTVFPRSTGTFFISREAISFMEVAVSRIVWISAASKARISSRSFRVSPIASSSDVGLGVGFLDHDAVLPVVLVKQDLDGLAARRRQVLPHVVRSDRELAMASIHEDGQLDHTRAPEVDDGIERRPNRPAGVEDIIDQHDRPVRHRKRDVGGPQDRGLPLEREVIPVERDVESTDGDRLAADRLQTHGDPARKRHAARPNAHQCEAVGPARPLDDLVGDPGEGAIDPGLVEHLGLLALAHGGAVRRARGPD